ncbi:MAG: 5-oxoprolinase subunit PxpA [Pseudomonadota bacterium]
MSKRIDLNADLGEGCAFDAELMSVVTSCNIACGGHAGDEQSMRTALQLAKDHNVATGAHPSFPDRENFGRMRSTLQGAELEAQLAEQVGSLKALAKDGGLSLRHLKPHGALYNMAAQDAGLSESIVAVLLSLMPQAALYGPPNSILESTAKREGIRFIAEGFADRAYEADGSLRDRKQPGAVIHDAEVQTEQALQLAISGEVDTYGNQRIALPVQTICVHGDTPGAFEAAQSIRRSLEQNGLRICPPN